MFAISEPAGVTPWLTIAEEQQLLVLGLALVVALLVNRFVMRRLLRRLFHRLGERALLKPLGDNDEIIGAWLDRLLSLLVIVGAVVVAIVIAGVDIQGLTDWLQDLGTDLGSWSVIHIPRIMMIAGIAYLVRSGLLRVLPLTIRNTLLRGKNGIELDEAIKRSDSLMGVARYTVNAGIVLVTVLTILPELGVSTGPILAGLGVVGIAIGFGAQNLIRDVIAGIFVLAEDQYRVGDVASVGGKVGLVEAVSLRRTVLRDLEGIVHMIPNGEITSASNYTKEFSRINLDISVAYKEDMDHVIRVLNRVGNQISRDEYFGQLIIEPPQVLGVDSFDASGITVKVLGVSKPIRQWEIARELRRRIKREFDQEGIEIPFPQQTVHWAEGAHPAAQPPIPTTPKRRRRFRANGTSKDEGYPPADPFVLDREDANRLRHLESLMEGTGVKAVDLFTHLEQVRQVTEKPPLGLFIDIDGTLARIVRDPKDAAIAPAVRQMLVDLSRRMNVVVVSGRSVADARRIIGLDSLVYACNHGLEWWYQGSSTTHPGVRPYRRQLRNLVRAIKKSLLSYPGIHLEDKGPTISLHYRQTRQPMVARDHILNFLNDEAEAKGLNVRRGKMVVEVRPPIAADKGTALRWVVENHGIRGGIVIGDDDTDLDSFHMVGELTAREDIEFRGVKLGVVGADATADLLAEADFHMLNPESVELFLQWLADARPLGRTSFDVN